MKKILCFTSIALIVLGSSSVMAEGSKIEKSTLINASKNTLTNTQSIGENSTAQTGSISVKGSKVEKSTVINASSNTLTNTQSIGKGSSAQTGSVDIK